MVVVHSTVNVLNITDLYTLKWLILCCVKFSTGMYAWENSVYRFPYYLRFQRPRGYLDARPANESGPLHTQST